MGFESKSWLVLPLLFLLASCWQKCVNGESQVPCLFIFGDSLSDSGNNNDLPTTAKSNYNPYGIDFPTGPTGRFTNCRTTIDIITQFLGFEDFIPPFANTSGSDILKGVNYASGSAGIRNESGTLSGACISLGSQLANHRVIVSQIAKKLGNREKAQQYLNRCLYYVNIGNNDYLNNYFLPQFYPTSSIYSPEQYAEALIEELSVNLLDLHDIGARKYVLVGLGLIGCTPYGIYTTGNGSCAEEENAAAFIFNDKLKSLVELFNNKLSATSKFIFINTTSIDQENTLVSGISVTDAACCSPGLLGECIPDEIPCYNRSDYVFWDEFHTTEAWNLLTAIKSYDTSSNQAFTYPLDIKHLVLEQDLKMELKFINGITSQLSGPT
ncbi:GDSL esterase/lipase At1g29670-like [Lotus japonicus]|uniref:GDSL esterase/lipase At1g29670-like n=1 Tax=Lotus japonicus TaxID=34305 RepID=UPI00258629E2|nr:GDSL esterase/lipase At1g29670-like [Lotus japonicus]